MTQTSLRQILFAALAALHFVSPTLGAEEVDWSIVSDFGDDIFPSLIIATSTMKSDAEEDETVLGDPMGMLGVGITAPWDDAVVRVEVESQKLIRPSAIEVTLPKGGEDYFIYPLLKYDYDSLLKVRQPFPEIVSVSVTVDGEDAGTQEERMIARSINDCPFGVQHEDGDFTALDVMFAAYVNENHPVVDEILSDALNSGDTKSFAGYQGNSDEVLREMEAVWNALKKRGFSYSSITRPSVQDEAVYAQHVRLVGDSVKTAQANCVDGSVLLASIFLKLGLRPFLVSIPGHMFMGVYLDRDQKEFACIETTMLSSSSFEEAVKAGNESFREHEEQLTAEEQDNPEFALIDLVEARELGILPLREPSAD